MSKLESDWFSIRTDAGGDEYVASTGDEVLVVPLTDSGEVLLAVEPSPAFGVPVRVLPGGQVELDLTLAEVANKELQEEIGYRAGRLDFLGEQWPWAKYLAVRSHLFLARDLAPSKLAMRMPLCPLAACPQSLARDRIVGETHIGFCPIAASTR